MIELKTLPQKQTLSPISRVFLIGAMAVLAGIVNGFLGTGGGIVMMYALALLPKGDDESARDKFATVIAAILPISLISAIFYGRTVDMNGAVPYLLPGILGGIAGAILLAYIKPSLLKRLFAIMVIWAGINFLR